MLLNTEVMHVSVRVQIHASEYAMVAVKGDYEAGSLLCMYNVMQFKSLGFLSTFFYSSTTCTACDLICDPHEDLGV